MTKSGRGNLDVFYFVFPLYCEPVDLLEVTMLGFINADDTYDEHFLTSTVSYFLLQVPCFFFGGFLLLF